MNPKKETTPERAVRRKYEETHKEQRRNASGNFQTMLPRAEYEKLCAYIEEQGISKADFIRKAYETLSGQPLKTKTTE